MFSTAELDFNILYRAFNSGIIGRQNTSHFYSENSSGRFQQIISTRAALNWKDLKFPSHKTKVFVSKSFHRKSPHFSTWAASIIKIKMLNKSWHSSGCWDGWRNSVWKKWMLKCLPRFSDSFMFQQIYSQQNISILFGQIILQIKTVSISACIVYYNYSTCDNEIKF